MKKILSVLFVTLLFICSCSNNEDLARTEIEDTPKANERMVFKNSSEMSNILTQLSSISSLDKKEWSKTHIVKSYYGENSIIDTTLTYAPAEIKAVLNSNLEFGIGDSIFWYNNNKIFLLSDKEDISQEEIYALKKNPENLKIVWKQKYIPIERKNNGITNNSRLITPNNSYEKYHVKTITTDINKEQALFLGSTNPNLPISTNKIRVKIEFISYEWSSSLWGGAYDAYFKVHLAYENNGRMLEIPDPIFQDVTLSGMLFYSYKYFKRTVMNDTPMSDPRPTYDNRLIQKMDPYFSAKINEKNNDIYVFKQSFSHREDYVEGILIAITNGAMNIRIGTAQGVDKSIIVDIEI